MSLVQSDVCFNDFIIGNKLNFSALISLLGPLLDWEQLGKFCCSSSNLRTWVWLPSSSKASITSAVYSYLNDSSYAVLPWRGWRAIWALRTAPRVKVFVWKLALGKLPTCSYLFRINLSPNLECTLCGLENDSSYHLFWLCSKSRVCWLLVSEFLGLNSSYLDSFADLGWLYDSLPIRADPSFARALIATCCWLIWKARCNSLFRNEHTDFYELFHRALRMTHEYVFKTPLLQLLREVPPSSFSESLILFTDASWINSSSWAGSGFAVIDNFNHIVLAGSSGFLADSPLMAEAMALELALLSCRARSIPIRHIFTDCGNLVHLLLSPEPSIAWRFVDIISRISDLLDDHPDSCLSVADRSANSLADSLASFGRRNPDRSLFFQGMDLPRWLMDAAVACNLFF